MAQVNAYYTWDILINGFSAITFTVPDVSTAAEEYQHLLGVAQSANGEISWRLANVAVEIRQADLEKPVVGGVALWSEQPAVLPENRRGLPLSIRGERYTSDQAGATGIAAVDHIVLRTADAEDCIRLFAGDLGLRLALDQSVPEWGGRMLFFRCGKLTLEVIQTEEPPAEDFFWGITYRCADLEATLAALDAAGVAHSGARLGRKPGTRVATVKSHTLGIPTLLLGPAD